MASACLSRRTGTTGYTTGKRAAVRFDNRLHFHPGRYLAGIAAAVTTGGGIVLEETRVTDLKQQRDRTVN
ncbi:FAD-binding oxidoreductase [Kribbella sp. NBC_01245]|uniref:FAD-dependent oxidoreductase n=1 Tax=Kribbella sp. NBC_01245 TaxID=2903578 RepID=UPI002E2D2AD9|nr:FAD-dependent oxidoreductase [Kribbella sp. NBC_01245]